MKVSEKGKAGSVRKGQNRKVPETESFSDVKLPYPSLSSTRT